MAFDYKDNKTASNEHDQIEEHDQSKEIFSIKKNPSVQKKVTDNFKRRKYLPNNISNKKTTSFHVSDVPSRFKAYPEKSRIFASNYSYWDIKNYNDSILPDDVAIEILLEGIQPEGFDKYELTIPDFGYIKFLRKLSYFPDFSCNTIVYCHECDTEIKTLITVPMEGRVSIIDFYDILADLPIRAKFKSFQGEHTFMPITIGQHLELIRNDKLFIKNKDKKYLLDAYGNKITDKISVLSSMCTSMEYKEAFQKISKVVEKVDIDTLDKIDEVLDCGIKPIEVRCTKCEAINIIDLEEEDEIILNPFRTDDNPEGFGILSNL